MPVTSQTPLISYTASGSTVNFPFPFRAVESADLKVYLNGVLQTSGYSVTGFGVDAGGTVTFAVAPVAGTIVRLQRLVSLDRQTDWVEGGALPATTLDYDSDRAIMMIQDLNAIAFKEASDGAVDALGKRFKNLADPVNAQDAVNKQYHDSTFIPQLNSIVTTGQSTLNTIVSNGQTSIASAIAAGETSLNTIVADGQADINADITTGQTNINASVATATTQATNAATSAAASATSATNAATSASGANTAKTNAETAATNSANSATDSATSATASATSATNAATSETNAAASATAAQVAKITWHGAWNSGTAYVLRDAVQLGGNSYICVLAHTNQTPPNASYWDLLASKGNDGTSGTGTGDVVSDTTVSVDSEIALFSGSAGKTIKRATGTGIVKITSGVLGTAVAGTDYLSSNQTITISGDATGSGSTAITLALATTGVGAGTYQSVTVDTKGRVTAGTNPTTLSGYGITDAAPLASPSLTGTPLAPTASFGTATTQIATTAFVDALRDIASSAQSTSYTLALTDRGKSVDTTASVTIPANASIAFPVGSVVTITNTSGANITIAITTDTLRLAGTATTGSRTLAQYGVATIRKIASTTWVIAGTGLS